MSYVGNTNTTQAFTPAIDYFSGNGSTVAFTLSRPVASVAQVQVVVNNVAQNPTDAYTVLNNTITFTGAPSSGTNNIYVYYTSPITQVIQPGQGTVSPTSLSTGGPVWNTSGNVGIGVSPNAWGTLSSALQIKNGATFVGYDSKYTIVGQNAYTTASADIYINNGFASQYYQVDGTHVWRYAPSGTAGASFSYTEAMRLDSSGNLGIGTSTPNSTAGFANITLNKSSGGIYDINVNGTLTGRYYATSSATFIGSVTSIPLVFNTGGTEQARINAAGVFCIGRTAPESSEKLSVNGAGRFEGGITLDNNGDSTEGGEIGLVAGTSYSSFGKSIDSFATDLRVFGGGTWQVSIFSTSGTANLSVQGSVSKGSGSFKIDHPLPEKADTHHLVHSFIEGPQADNIYRGKVTLAAGRAEVNIDTVSGMTDGTFVLLNRDVQCFTSNESSWDAVRGTVVGNVLTIECQNSSSTASVSWMVIGERQDKHMYDTDWTDENGRVIVEPIKPEPMTDRRTSMENK
jgi:hypothetical protein